MLHRVDPDKPPALEFDASLIDGHVSDGSPGVIELTLTNTSATTQEIFSGTVPPFGMIFAEAVDSNDEFLLWRKYEEEGCITFGFRGWSRCNIGIITELQADEILSRRYKVLPSSTSHQPRYTVPPGPNTYQFTDTLTYNEGRGAPNSELTYEVEFDLVSE